MPMKGDGTQDQMQPIVRRKLNISNDPDLYFLSQVSEEISAQHRHTEGQKKRFATEMLQSALDGNLATYDIKTGRLLSREIAELTTPRCVRPADVNDWGRAYKAPFVWTPSEKIKSEPPQTNDASVCHSTKTRRDSLTPVIEQAQKRCNDQQDTAAVWAALQALAEEKVPPLRGATEDGLQYLKNGNAAIFTRESLRKRLVRQTRLTTVKHR